MNNYFYAQAEEADLYDDTIALTQPEYFTIHSIAAHLVHRSLGNPESSADATSMRILDIGAGTGTELFALLSLRPAAMVVAFDKSERMLKILSRKLQTEAPQHRVTCVSGDILDAQWNASALCSHIEGRRFDAIISGFLIHHFSIAQRRNLYQRCYEALCEGGVFVNIDLFDFQAPTLSQYAEEVGENWVSEQLSSRSRSEYQQTVARLGPKANELRTKWIAHLRNENIPGPIESPGEAISTQLASTMSQSEVGNSQLLLDAGFQEVGCPFRYWQAGVLWAKK